MFEDTQLVDPAWLAEHLSDDDVIVCDCRFAGTQEASRSLYLAGHIPGAIHVYWLRDLCTADTSVTSLLPTPAEAERLLGALGIGRDTVVVGYVEAGSAYAARLWHVLAHHGHGRVALLDGGLDGWIAENHALDQASSSRPAAAFEASIPNDPISVTAEEILVRLEDPGLTLVDVRAPAEFDGSQRRAARGGHIPGAVLLPWDGDLRADGTMRQLGMIRARAGAAGLGPDDELVTYCQGGVRAAHAAFALRLAGYPRVRVYTGSWAEWGNDPRLPVEAPMIEQAV